MHPKTKSRRLENERKPSTSASTPSFPKYQPQNIHNHPVFPIGSEVEVTSNEEGFTGAWYLATVVQSPTSSHSSQHQRQGKIFVEYKNLLSDDNGNNLLKEYVDAHFVRPKHPIEEHDKVYFEVNDVVDAFFQDGWWCGVVTHVVSRNKYRVFFSNPPDQIEFQSSDLRIHKDWVYGKWVLSKNERMRDWNSTLRTSVEVNIDPEYSCDVWFPATLIKQVANNTFLVEYQSSKGLQRVTVDSLHIRPPPPSSSVKTFNLLEKVDALYDLRWLSGVVTKILADGRYIVYFKHTKKEKELSHAELRPHMEWHNGKWVLSLQDTSTASNAEMCSNHVVNVGNKVKGHAPSECPDAVMNNVAVDKLSTVTLNKCQEELQKSGNGKAIYSSATPSNKRIKQTSANGNAIQSRSSRRLNEEPASNLPLSTEKCKSKMTQLEVLDNGTSVDAVILTPGHLPPNTKQSEGINPYPTEMKGENDKHPSAKKRGRPPKLRAFLSGDTQGENVEQTPNKGDVVKPSVPIIVGLTHNGKMIGSLVESSSEHLKLEYQETLEDEMNYVDSSADHESVVSNGSEQQKEGKVTNLKRKRGRPPKVLFQPGSPTTKNAEFVEEKKDATSDPLDDEKHSQTIEEEMPIATIEPSQNSDASPIDDDTNLAMKISDHMKRLSDIDMFDSSTSRRQARKRKKVPTKSIMMDINEPVKSIRKGKKQKSTKQVVPQTLDDVNNCSIRAIEVFNNGVARDADKVVAGTSSNASDDDRPLSVWFEGAHTPTADAKIPLGGTTAGQSGQSGQDVKTAHFDKLKGKEQDKRQPSSAENLSQEQDSNAPGGVDKTGVQAEYSAIVPVDNRDLPFSKNSRVWEMIESMEVLKRVPQKPHFRPLYNCKEECREGLAIGSMVTFTSLVERISKSQFSDPKSILDGYLEALVDLEELGFNVAPVREKLNDMISIKRRSEQAENTSTEIESQIMELNLEKSDINEEIIGIDKKIGELMEKRSLAMAKKERKDAEITVLQSSIDSVKSDLESAEREFLNATSLW